MPRFEYKVVPAPEQGKKGKGIRGPKGRFANALESLMNEMGAEGWDYLRADTLPFEERTGLTGKTTTFQNLLVFRREISAGQSSEGQAPEVQPVAGLLAAPSVAPAPVVAAPTASPQVPSPAAPHPGPSVPAPEVQSRDTKSAAASAVAALSAYRRRRRSTETDQGDLAAE